MLVSAWIGLGSNLDDPRGQLRRAAAALAELPQSRLVALSGHYGSSPLGPQDQPDYVNAAARLDTALEPLALLDALQAIENAQGRVRARRWGERTLDLDLLLYGRQRIDLPRLQVPHPGLPQRAFVLCPLAEIAGEGLPVPGFGRLGELLRGVSRDGLWPLDDGSSDVDADAATTGTAAAANAIE